MNYWLISDTHFGDERLVTLCGRPADFAVRTLSALARCVRPNDVLIHCGDFCIRDDAAWHARFMDATPGRKWLLRGNHDRQSLAWYLGHGWDFVADTVTLKVFGKTLLFSHTPHPVEACDLNLHGHFHTFDHRRHEPHYSALLGDKHRLFALEDHYAPINLRTAVESDKGLRRPGEANRLGDHPERGRGDAP